VLIWLTHSCAEVNLDVSGFEALLSALAFSSLLNLDHHLLVLKTLEGESREDGLLRNDVKIFRVAQGKLLVNALGRNDTGQL
jgi:hypothetical protein